MRSIIPDGLTERAEMGDTWEKQHVLQPNVDLDCSSGILGEFDMLNKSLMMLWAAMLLAGCAGPISAPTPPASQTPVLTATNPPAIMPSPTPGMTATPEIRFTRQCLPVEDREVELKEVASGTLFLIQYDLNPPRGNKFVDSLMDIQSGSEHKLPNGSAYLTESHFDISPNRNMIAKVEGYLNEKLIDIRDVLWVFDAQGKVLSKMTLSKTGLGQPSWLDNERLLIDTEKYGTLLLVNPFTKEQRVIADELPNPDLYSRIGIWWPVVYSPDLKWVTYHENTLGTVVYDLVKKQYIWNAGGGMGDPAVWSPDGQEVAFNTGRGEYQLYLIQRSGQFKAVLDSRLPHTAHAFSWSPDGRNIAFWNDDSLVIYDRQMDWVFDTCIRGYGGGGYVSPYWSPDSQQLIVYGYSNPNIPIFVDWQKKKAYKIKGTPNSDIAGWMNSIP